MMQRHIPGDGGSDPTARGGVAWHLQQVQEEVRMDKEKPTTPKAQRPSTPPVPKGGKPNEVAVVRRDATGHIDPTYAAGLRAVGQETKPPESPRPAAFLHGMRSSDRLAEELGEDFVRRALSGEDDAEDDASDPLSAHRERSPKA